MQPVSLLSLFPPFIPANMILAPAGATHFSIGTAGADVDFEQGIHLSATSKSAEIAWDNEETILISRAHELNPNSTQPLFILLGIEFFQQVNGSMYPLKNGAFNALAIIKVSAV